MKYILNNEELTQEQFYIELNKEIYDTQKTDDIITLIYSEERHKKTLRLRRESECFPIINRGYLWYSGLAESQQLELGTWYQSWLDVTDTKEVPVKLKWLEGV